MFHTSDATGHSIVAMPIIADATELARHLGQRVTRRGTVSRTKIPEILGVEVEGAAIAAPEPGAAITASKGAGTYLVVLDAVIEPR